MSALIILYSVFLYMTITSMILMLCVCVFFLNLFYRILLQMEISF